MASAAQTSAPPLPRTRTWAIPAALLGIAIGLLGLFSALLYYGISVRTVARETGQPGVVRLEIPDLDIILDTKLQDFSADEAKRINANRPVELPSVAPAKPFTAVGRASAGHVASAAYCLTQAIYYEAATESGQGQRAVAQVVLNRVRHPAFPHSVCEVVYQGSERSTGCQFSFTCDGSLARIPSATGWARARAVALAALAGWVEPSVGTSTHYHADYVLPYWASSLNKVRTIGAHIFYQMRGGAGAPSAFFAQYAADRERVPLLSTAMAAADPLLTEDEGAVSTSQTATPAMGVRLREDEIAQQGLLADRSGTPVMPDTPRLIIDEAPSTLIAPGRRIEGTADMSSR